MTKHTQIVFFGSGPVAAKSLELLQNNFNIEAVITKPKPAHHKNSFPVIDICEKYKIPYITCTNKNELSKLIAQSQFKSEIGVLIDYGIIVNQDVIDAFPLGIVNSHFSILPDLRGADPISFAILSGQKTTGVSLMLLVKEMDEGPLIAYNEYKLPQTITTPLLTEHLIQFSDKLLVAELPKYIANGITFPQSITGRKTSYSKKLTKNDGLLDWNLPATILERQIRAFIEWPKSYTKIADINITVTKAEVVKKIGETGDIIIKDKQLIVNCAEDALRIISLIPTGKKEMTTEAFLNGHKNLLDY